MKVVSRFSAVSAVLLLTMSTGLGQHTNSAPPATQPPAAGSYGQPIFSRSSSSAEQDTNAVPAQPKTPALARPAKELVSDVERTSLTYTSYRFEVHLEPDTHSLAVHAHVTAQNSSDKPLARIALQLSSALHWYSIHLNGEPVKFQTESIESDIDHTGQLTEAVVSLAAPLAPGATVQLDVIYSGQIVQSAERLLRLGAPAKIAATSEWDRIGPDFTALRGFGNVIWFPVSTAPVLLGQGPQVFDSIGKWKLRESAARVSMHVLVEYLHSKPTVAFLNGYPVQPDRADEKKSTAGKSVTANASPAPQGNPGDILQVASFKLPPTTLGFTPLSFFVTDAAVQDFPGLDIYAVRGDESSATAYRKILDADRPLTEQWLGPHAKRPVILVDLPGRAELPFEERNILFIPLQANATNDSLGPVLAHMLSHSYFISPRPWLNEGLAQFMTLQWIEERAGRATAIAEMDTHRAALALAETSDPGIDPGQSLINAWSDIYYRNKASDVLWMLRDIVGDAAMAKALQAYDPAQDREPSYFQRLLQKASGKDLEWFFDDWVYRDRGLPDLHILSAYRRPIVTKNSSTRNFLVSVEVRNDSFCSAEVPVTVEAASTTQIKRLLVPSHTSATLRVLVDSQPTQVIVNDGSVPEVRTTKHERTIVPAP